MNTVYQILGLSEDLLTKEKTMKLVCENGKEYLVTNIKVEEVHEYRQEVVRASKEFLFWLGRSQKTEEWIAMGRVSLGVLFSLFTTFFLWSYPLLGYPGLAKITASELPPTWPENVFMFVGVVAGMLVAALTVRWTGVVFLEPHLAREFATKKKALESAGYGSTDPNDVVLPGQYGQFVFLPEQD